MTTLEKIKAEIAQLQDEWFEETDGWWCYEKALQILDKYSNEQCEFEEIKQYAKEHRLILVSEEMAEQYRKIAEQYNKQRITNDVLHIFDKYAEQTEIQADYDKQKASGMTDEEWEYGKGEPNEL